MDRIIIENGVVAAKVYGAAEDTDRQSQVASLTAELSAMRAALEALGGAPLEPKPREPRTALARRVKNAEAALAHLSCTPASPPGVAADDHPDAQIGAPLTWPRGERNRRLAETDYVDLASWRVSKPANLLTSLDAYREALRALPETSPQAIGVTWPAKPTSA